MKALGSHIIVSYKFPEDRKNFASLIVGQAHRAYLLIL